MLSQGSYNTLKVKILRKNCMGWCRVESFVFPSRNFSELSEIGQ